MKTVASLIVILLLSVVSSHAQFQIPEIDKVKEIKLLQSTAFDVQRILVGFETDGWEPGDSDQRFSTNNYSIKISYSSGQCSEDEEIWDVRQWVVTEIEIKPDDSLNVKKLGYDFSKFKKEQVYIDRPEIFIFHDKSRGFAFEINEKESTIRKIILFPQKTTSHKLCDNDTAKNFVAKESWFGNSKLKDRSAVIREYSANITDVQLGKTELKFTDSDMDISVEAIADTDKDDIVTYKYEVSAGKIVGEGPKVTWSLKGLLPGTYTITAGVDDGCGICGKTMTKTVTIR